MCPLEVTIMSSAAKTVSFSPLRRGHFSVKNILDTPFKLKWPDVSPQVASLLLRELEKSLSDLKGHFARDQLPRATKRRKHKNRGRKQAARSTDSESQAPPRKKLCLENTQAEATISTKPSHSSNQGSTMINTETTLPTEISLSTVSDLGQSQNTISAKRSQMVVGVNSVTRSLERGELCAGLVCLSARPALVTRHIMMLAATRSVPFAALPNLSRKTADLLRDIKSALAIGFKKNATSQFTSLIETISKHAPPITIPWLSTVKTDSTLSIEDHQTVPHTDQPSSVKTVKSQKDAYVQAGTPISTALKEDSPSTTAEVTTQAKQVDGAASEATVTDKECTAGEKRAGETHQESSKHGSEVGGTSLYTPVQIKKTIVRTKKKKWTRK